jgi:hypothetical protein
MSSLKKKKIFGEVRLIPTLFYLDVWINWTDRKELASKYAERYGLDYDEIYRDITESECSFIESSKDCILNGEKRIVLNISEFSYSILVHELVHVFYHLDEHCNLGSDQSNQEWIAYFTGYVFDEIMKLFDNNR